MYHDECILFDLCSNASCSGQGNGKKGTLAHQPREMKKKKKDTEKKHIWT